MHFDYLKRNAAVLVGLIIILIISYGCTQLTPSYLTASAYEKSLTLYNEGRIAEVREKLAGIKKGEYDYKAAQELLFKMDILSSRLSEKHRELAEEYEKASLYSLAANEYRLALKFDPTNQSTRKKPIEERKEKETKPIEERNEKETKTVNREAIAKKHYGKGVAFLESKQFAKAIDEFTSVMKLIPSYSDTEKLLASAKKERDEIVDAHLKKGIDYFQKEELELAISEWDLVLELDPFNKTAIDYKTKAETIKEKMKDIREKNK